MVFLAQYTMHNTQLRWNYKMEHCRHAASVHTTSCESRASTSIIMLCYINLKNLSFTPKFVGRELNNKHILHYNI